MIQTCFMDSPSRDLASTLLQTFQFLLVSRAVTRPCIHLLLCIVFDKSMSPMSRPTTRNGKGRMSYLVLPCLELDLDSTHQHRHLTPTNDQSLDQPADPSEDSSETGTVPTTSHFCGKV